MPVYDRVFAASSGAAASPGARAPAATFGVVEEVEVALASRVEVLRHKSFARCSPEELAGSRR